MLLGAQTVARWPVLALGCPKPCALPPCAHPRCRLARLQVVREHYLRDDIWSGSPLDPQVRSSGGPTGALCEAGRPHAAAGAPHVQCHPSAHKLAEDAAAYLVIDTNIALHQVLWQSCQRLPQSSGCTWQWTAAASVVCQLVESSRRLVLPCAQMDLLEHAAVTDVIIPSVVLEEASPPAAPAVTRPRTAAFMLVLAACTAAKYAPLLTLLLVRALILHCLSG